MTVYACHKICRYIPSIHHTERQTQITCQHLHTVGPTSKTLGRRCTNAIQMPCACRDWPKVERLSLYNKHEINGKTSNARRQANAGSMTAHLLRRRPSIKPAPAQRLSFAGKRSSSKSETNAGVMQARRLRRLALWVSRLSSTDPLSDYGGPL